MFEVQVIDDPAAAVVALEPVRSRLLSELASPASAATLAGRLGIARQKVNYHLRALERHELVEVAAERRWGGLTERLLVATAAAYVVSPAALGQAQVETNSDSDRLSASYLIALASRIVREMSHLLKLSRKHKKRLATLSIDTEVRFRTPTERADFSKELVNCVAGLVSRYHDESAPTGRPHRLIIMAHPTPGDSPATESRCHLGEGMDSTAKIKDR